MISWTRTLSVYKDFWYTYYKSIGHRQMFLLPTDRADVVYTETPLKGDQTTYVENL